MLLQGSSKTGQVFTQTDALDGERNYKSKLTLKESQADLVGVLMGTKLRI